MSWKRILAIVIVLTCAIGILFNAPMPQSKNNKLVIPADNWKYWLDGGWVHMWVDPDVACSAYAYENNVLVPSLAPFVPIIAAGTNFQWPGASTGSVAVGVLCTDGVDNVWLNFTYVIPPSYAWFKIRLFDQEGNLLEFDGFDIYINGTITYDWENWLMTERSYLVLVTDIWGTTLNSTLFSMHSVTNLYVDVQLTIYKLYVTNFSTAFHYIRISRSGSSSYLLPKFIAPKEERYWSVYTGTYTLIVMDSTLALEYAENLPVTTTDSFWVITGTGIETLYQHLKGLNNMTEATIGSLNQAIGAMNTTTSSFGMLFWLAIVIVLFSLIMLFSLVRKRPINFEMGGFTEEEEEPQPPIAPIPETEYEHTIEKYNELDSYINDQLEKYNAQVVYGEEDEYNT
jgi:hypothetical protein